MSGTRRGRSSRRRLTCGEARPLLSVVLDGEANDLERAAAARHLRTCQACRRFSASVRDRQSVLRATGDPRIASSPTAVPDEYAASAGLAPTRGFLSAVTAELPAEACGGRPFGARSNRRADVPGCLVRTAEAWARRLRAVPRVAAALAAVTIAAVSLSLWSGEAPRAGARTLALPRVTLSQNLDPSYVPYLEQDLHDGPVMVAGTADEKLLFFESPMSFHDQFHYQQGDL